MAGKRSGRSPTMGANAGWMGMFAPFALASIHAATAAVSRCVNYALSEQLQHAYGAAERARDYAIAAAAIAVRDYPDGTAREAVLAALLRQRTEAERLMDALLGYGRKHGRLAFAFPVYG
jgi:hypothetical protein